MIVLGYDNHEDAVRKVRAELPKYVAALMRDDPEYAARVRRALEISKPIVADLVQAGYNVKHLDDLRHMDRRWDTAIPILQRWLPLVEDVDTKENIVRCLSVPWVGGAGTLQLIEEFKNAAPQHFYYAWAIGDALSTVSIKGFENEIVSLCRQKKYGKARQMIVYRLDRIRRPEAEDVALDLLDDPDVRLHAIHALRQMKSKRALFPLEKLLNDRDANIRKHARSAITKISRSL